MMNTQLAANEWGTCPAFQANNTPRPSTVLSALSKGGSENVAATGWNSARGGGLDAAVYAADTMGDAQKSNNGALAVGAADTNVANALVKADPATTMAVAITCTSVQRRENPFSGLYDDVHFPVHTFFTPPRPPGELMPRVRRPNFNKKTVYANDISRAGPREHNAQREVSRMWRGVLCRRKLRQARQMETFLNERTCKIQCWWRSLQAKWCRRQLTTLRSEWAKERTAQYVRMRVLNSTNVLYWQHSKFEGAALRIQRVVRWYLREKERQRSAMAGLPESEWPPALEKPVAEHRRPYFPWRQKQFTSTKEATGALVEVERTDVVAVAEAGSALPTHRTLLQFRKTPHEVPPPTQEEVERINAKMREKEAQRAAALQTPEAVSRNEWKREGLRQEDLDFNAGIVQRLYRSKRAPVTVHTKELTAAYFNKAARLIARTFRMYVLIKRMQAHKARITKAVRAKIARRSAAKIEELKTEAVWQKELMDAAATSIQRCWAWYRYHRHGIVPASYRATNTVPTPPCYHLIEANIEREHALRWTRMNLLERHEFEEQRHHKYFRYVPKNVEVYEHTGYLFVQPPAEAKL